MKSHSIKLDMVHVLSRLGLGYFLVDKCKTRSKVIQVTSCDVCTSWVSSFAPDWVRLAPNGTNLWLFKISFSTFWLSEPKCTETDLKKSQICPIWGQSDQLLMLNLKSLVGITNFRLAPKYKYDRLFSKSCQIQ